MKIREIGVLDIGTRWRGTQLGRLRAVMPLPVDSDACLFEAGLRDFADSDDAWDQDFDRLIGMVLEGTFGTSETEVVAPLRAGESPWGRFLRWLTFRPLLPTRVEPLNPGALDARSALSSAARDDQQLQFASVNGPRASVHASDGHPIFWIWTAGETTWHTLEQLLGRRWPTKTLDLVLSALSPPMGYAEGPVVAHAAENAVFWTDGAGVLALRGEFALPHPGNVGCSNPRKVFVPPEEQWAGTAPSWASGAYSKVVRDLETHGLHLVYREDALVQVTQSSADAS